MERRQVSSGESNPEVSIELDSNGSISVDSPHKSQFSGQFKAFFRAGSIEMGGTQKSFSKAIR